jgi:uncharacterized protein
MTKDKITILDSILKDLGSFIIGFSGGVDSTVLLYRAKLLNLLKIKAVTIRTKYIPAREISETTEFTKSHGIDHEIIDLEIPDNMRHNPIERCYLCKKTLFTALADFAGEHGFKYVIDGTNTDDSVEFRPGLKALNELNVRSPLAEAGLTKSDIREYAKKAGLPIWDKPAMACLLTRIPYNSEVTDETLQKIEKAENLLFDKGYPGARVRVHGDVARIECLPGYVDRIFNDPRREVIVSELKQIGFRYISLDMEGYRTGSMDPEKKDYDGKRTGRTT